MGTHLRPRMDKGADKRARLMNAKQAGRVMMRRNGRMLEDQGLAVPIAAMMSIPGTIFSRE